MRWTLLLIGLATVLIGLLPTYAQVGVIAPLGLLMLRVVQGLAAGGEWAGAVLMIGASDPAAQKEKKNGLAFALSQSGVAFGMLLGGVALWAAQRLGHDAFFHYGWRLPFIATAPFLLLGLWLRSSPRASEATSEANSSDVAASGWAVMEHGPALLCGVALRMAESACIYLILVFGLSYGSSVNIPVSWLLTANTVAIAADALAIPFFGWLSDRIGAGRTFAMGAAAMGVGSALFFQALHQNSLSLLILGFAGGVSLCHAPMIAAEPILLARMFPSRVRYRGVAMAHELGGVLAGGLTPLIAAGIVHQTQSVVGVVLYLFALSFLALGCLRGSRRLRRRLSSVAGVRYEQVDETYISRAS
ncbi:major facilitator superfamily transporter [Acetobacter nitrogenifigens DSM 23921 = NBRC 105050]|nr:major facilitator superfamily transporter [Acetobacter nitrogenifigens DSM 23921 = NBRC 105050]